MIKHIHDAYMVMTDDGPLSRPYLGPTYFTREDDAKRAARKRMVDGTDAKVVKSTAVLIIYDSFDEFVDHNRRTLRQSGLRKLTTEEQEALGITE